MPEGSKADFMTVLLKFCSNLALLTAFGLTLKKGSGELDPEYKQTNKHIYNHGWIV